MQALGPGIPCHPLPNFARSASFGNLLEFQSTDESAATALPKRSFHVFIAEPPRTQFDLNFSLFGIPVRVHPLFWLMGVILGAYGAERAPNAGMLILIWVATVFVSILVHEFGHAFAMRKFGQSPRVVLYMMGGLAIPGASPYDFGYSSQQPNSRQQIIISAMGPIAGFMLAGVVIALVYLGGGAVLFDFGQSIFHPWRVQLERGVPIGGTLFSNENAIYLYYLIEAMLFVNIFWGLMNLLPVYPLDGGQISREVFVSKDPWDGLKKSLWVSVVTGAVVAGLGLFFLKSLFLGILFGMLAFGSYQVLQQINGRGGYGGGGRPW